jgi:hypothetical protein
MSIDGVLVQIVYAIVVRSVMSQNKAHAHIARRTLSINAIRDISQQLKQDRPASMLRVKAMFHSLKCPWN